jgi:hypothetical protein
MIQFQQGAAYGDNQRNVSETAFEADAVAVVIWTSLEQPRGTRTPLEENSYPIETTRHRPPIGYPARNCQPCVPGQCVGSVRTAFDRRRVTGKRPARTALNFV